MARFGLTLRLLGLLAASILPATAALVYVQIELRHERAERVGEGALHQARLLAAEIETTIDGARQLMLAVAASPSVQALAPACADQLRPLHDRLGSYGLIAVVGGDQRTVCAAGSAPPPGLRDQLAGAIAGGHFVVGRYSVAPGGTAMLPMILPFTTAAGARAAVIVTINLQALGHKLAHFHTAQANSLTVADIDGTIIVRLPDPARWIGHKVAPGARALIHAASAGTAAITGLDGVARVVGYVPSEQTDGLYVAYGMYMPGLLVAIDQAAERGYVLIAVCAGLAVLLMLVITRRLVHAPTEALLHAAQRWSEGDLAARARVPARENGEFARLATAFNTMAEALDARRGELRQLNASLEARVNERTQALSDSNNRLQVEISERERTDAVLRQAQKLQAVGQLAGGTAHEFNNILATIMGALELLQLRLGDDSALRRYTAAAMEAAQRGARLTSQLLAFARRRRLMPVAVDLNTVIAEMRELIEGTLGRTLTLCITPGEGLWPALADRHEIEAAVLNLVLNARDAVGSAGTVRLATRNAPGGEDGEAFVELSVTDDGAGMTEEELAHAVDPFFTTKGPGQGTGLGLSQVHGIAQQLGGDLRIASRKGEGTTVRLLLPRAAAPAVPSATAALPCAIPRPLLLVDDDAQVRAISADMLTELGYEVTTAACGEEALTLMKSRGFAILVADYAMPGISGIELIRQAGRRWPDMMTLLITGFMEFDTMAEADVLQPRQVLRKPFTLTELSGRIAELAGEVV